MRNYLIKLKTELKYIKEFYSKSLSSIDENDNWILKERLEKLVEEIELKISQLTIKVIKLEDDLIEFDNGNRIIFSHDRDCCENVFAECGSIQKTNAEFDDIWEVEWDSSGIEFEQAKDIGVILVAPNGMKYLVSCYNIQNGYYSNNLLMEYQILKNGKYQTIYKENIKNKIFGYTLSEAKGERYY